MVPDFSAFVKAHAPAIWALGYRVALAFIVGFIGYMAAKAFRCWMRKVIVRSRRVDPTLVPVLSTVASYSVYALAAMLILDILGVNAASIFAVLGAAGLAVGLALRDTLGNIAAGIVLLILRPFRTGDYIQCPSVEGIVKEVGFFHTTLETSDGIYIFAPNGVLWGAPIRNMTRNPLRRIEFVVGIAYLDSIDKGLGVLRQVVAEEKRFLAEPAPQVMVSGITENAVNLQLRAWVLGIEYWDVWWDQNKKIKLAMQAGGLTLPHPQRELHIKLWKKED